VSGLSLCGNSNNVFENYDDLVLHINAVTIDDMHNYFEKNLDRDLEGVDALKLMAACYMQFAHENDSRWRALFEHFRPVDFDIPEWYLQKVSRLFSIPEELILPLVKGDIKNAQRVASVLWGGVHGIYSLGLTVDGCSEECSGPGSFFISCPDTREGCKEKKIRLGCGSFSFNENRRACKVFDCSGNCFLSGLFKVAEYETDYSYVEIFEDPETDTDLTVEWLNYEVKE